MVATGAERDNEAREITLGTYRITVQRGALKLIGDIARETGAHRFVIISDDNVAPLYAEDVRRSLGPARATLYTMPAGEANKTRRTWGRITDEILGDGVGRDSVVVALGGGVVGDIAGFVAATYMRGIPFIQMPTTLLAMVDASVGGKTGVDTHLGKNLVGAFHQPAAVIADPMLLATLPRAELLAGCAEAIKHGVIADADHFADATAFAAAVAGGAAPTEWPSLVPLIARSIEIKASVVAADEREMGVRRTLNFGHTIGHAVEAAMEFRLLHGQAVAIGMVIESRIAEKLGVAEPGTSARVEEACARAGLPVAMPEQVSPETVLAATRTDKKARGGVVRYALPLRIGAMAGESDGWAIEVPDNVVLESLASAD